MRKSSPPASIAFTRSVVSFSAVTKMTGMLFVRGSRLMRRQTLEARSIGRRRPRSPARHRHVEDAQVGACARSTAASAPGPVGRRDGAKAEHVKLIEQQFHVGRHVIGDEYQRMQWLAVRCCPRADYGRTAIPMLTVQACFGRREIGGSRWRESRQVGNHVICGKCSADPAVMLFSSTSWPDAWNGSVRMRSSAAEIENALTHVRSGDVGADARVPRVDSAYPASLSCRATTSCRATFGRRSSSWRFRWASDAPNRFGTRVSGQHRVLGRHAEVASVSGRPAATNFDETSWTPPGNRPTAESQHA